MKLASGILNVVGARKAGVDVGLGTDGVAGSNNDHDMWEAMDFAGKLAKVSTMDPTALPAKDLLRMATIEGARAMKMDDRIGSLEPGKRADLVAVDLSGARTQPALGRLLDARLRRQGKRRLPHDGRGARPVGRPERAHGRRAEDAARGGGVAAEDRGFARAAGPEMSLFVRTIVKKRDGGELSEGEIDAFVTGVTDGTITDEQAAAFLMAVCCRGMTTAESAALTFAMMRSGETWDLSRHGFVADKHSTGGVGDKATLVLAPLLAAVGVKAGMMSGRGLGHTGGTLDKLEAIPGFKTALPKADFDRLLDTVGCALIGQTDSIAPADRRLYALRDVTGTVESIPLITASILSKKLATGASAVVFDVKTGNGAFMADPKDAERLGKALVETTRATGRKASGYLTAMDRPLGEAVGNANEVEESIRMLGGEGPADLRENTLLLGADLVLAAGLETSAKEARRRLNAALSDGRALEVFRKLIAAQGGDASVCDDPKRLPQPVSRRDVPAPASGVVTRIATREVGLLAIELGCGRAKKDDVIDPASGFRVKKKPGDAVEKGEPLLVVELGPTAKPNPTFYDRLAGCFTIAPAGTRVDVAAVRRRNALSGSGHVPDPA